MKFKQYLQESDNVGDEWVKHVLHWGLDSRTAEKVDGNDISYEKERGVTFKYENGKIEIENINKACLVMHQETISSIPFDSKAWPQGNNRLESLRIIGAVIDTWDKMPIAQLLILDRCEFHTFKLGSLDGGIDNLTLDFPKVKCGLLGILKCKTIGRVGGTASCPKDLQLALQIINKHLLKDDRDILECQNELIDANLDEYAKL